MSRELGHVCRLSAPAFVYPYVAVYLVFSGVVYKSGRSESIFGVELGHWYSRIAMTPVSIFLLNARKSLVDAVLLSTEKSTAGPAIVL